MSYTVELIDYSDYNWHIEVLYKDQYIDSLNREEFEKLIGLLAVYTSVFDKKYDQDFYTERCELTYPFEVNIHMYNAEKLDSLMILLNNQYNQELEAWMKSTLNFEKEQYEIFKQASNEIEFNQYFNSLNDDKNILKFVLKELSVEKIVDLKFIENIDLVYAQYIESLDRRKERTPELYEDPKGHANQRYIFAVEFRKKYKSILKKIEDLKNI